MKSKLSIILILCVLFTTMLVPYTSIAEDLPTDAPTAATDTASTSESEVITQETIQKPEPKLMSIEFNGAVLESPITDGVFEYNLKVEEAEEFSLKSYKCMDYSAQMKIEYITNTNGATKGVIINVKNSVASFDYKFYFDSVKIINKTSDAALKELEFNYGELSPAFDPQTFKYTLYLPSDLEMLVIDAVKSDENAYISTPAQVTIGTAKNLPISVKITSSDGSVTNTYKLNIRRVDKTIRQIQDEMATPGYVTFVTIEFYNTPEFYIVAGTGLFAVAVLAVVIISMAKHKKNPEESDALSSGDEPKPKSEAQVYDVQNDNVPLLSKKEGKKLSKQAAKQEKQRIKEEKKGNNIPAQITMEEIQNVETKSKKKKKPEEKPKTIETSNQHNNDEKSASDSSEKSPSSVAEVNSDKKAKTAKKDIVGKKPPKKDDNSDDWLNLDKYNKYK